MENTFQETVCISANVQNESLWEPAASWNLMLLALLTQIKFGLISSAAALNASLLPPSTLFGWYFAHIQIICTFVHVSNMNKWLPLQMLFVPIKLLFSETETLTVWAPQWKESFHHTDMSLCCCCVLHTDVVHSGAAPLTVTRSLTL